MTDRRWKLSQITSLAFIASILALAVLGGFANASDTLMSETTAERPAQ